MVHQLAGGPGLASSRTGNHQTPDDFVIRNIITVVLLFFCISSLALVIVLNILTLIVID